MIDLHAHILPGLDDGPKDIEESLAMCEKAAADGIRAIVATPHTGNGVYENRRDRIMSSLSALREKVEKAGIPIVLFAGADVHANVAILDMIADGRAMTVNDNGSHVMIEMPDQVVPPRFEEWLFSLRLKGIVPILTHPERNMVIGSDQDFLAWLVAMGVLVQVTAMSITGHFGRAIEKISREMLGKGLVHVIATDAHSIEARPPVLSSARDVAALILGEEEARRLVEANPRSILEGRPIDTPQPKKYAQGFMKRILSRKRAGWDNVAK